MIRISPGKLLLMLLAVLMATTASAKSKPDFASIRDVKKKKAAFFDFIYPRVLEENKKILAERQLLKQADQHPEEVVAICEKYSSDCENIDAEKINTLLRRVDLVPPSLALAQGASESAWGTSRFATVANNYFGQWCFKKGCGLVPSRRRKGDSHEVRTFKSAQDSVQAYLFNLNTGRVYKDLRRKRQAARGNGKMFNGLELAAGLGRYSERGEAYVKEVQSMIRYNKLVEKYDKKFWADIEAYAKK